MRGVCTRAQHESRLWRKHMPQHAPATIQRIAALLSLLYFAWLLLQRSAPKPIAPPASVAPHAAAVPAAAPAAGPSPAATTPAARGTPSSTRAARPGALCRPCSRRQAPASATAGLLPAELQRTAAGRVPTAAAPRCHGAARPDVGGLELAVWQPFANGVQIALVKERYRVRARALAC